ncbi:hypothetical protein [Nocardia bovistercoris]|uniref:Uncharacterized protein n=1 Tax=Nocardia bovistercoris TaxID=2785916 RepID=A0A931IBR9_9NOCA|nr:hypothetical protein [Nocardia bovistercoris]MBH0777272.1 hypothetical protein [Nocardia bovistercoris]
MSGLWRQEPPAGHGYSVSGLDRGLGHHTSSAMAGPEFTRISAVYAPLSVLPLVPQLVVLAVLVLVGMGGCAIAWVDQQDYVPSPNICRVDQIPQADQLDCDAPTQVPAGGR